MLTAEENERLTRVGPGTPMGTLMRWYWHPISASVSLAENPVRKVRILGEDLVLYRDKAGGLGLIGDRCAHRSTGMQYGIPEADGLRCPYHGWKYDATGQCIDQPLEPPGSAFKDRIALKAYPVEELAGLIWAYLGLRPAPLLPRWDFLARPNAFRQIFVTTLPCNWLQAQENGGDPRHGIYLHGHYFQYVLEQMAAKGKEVPEELWKVPPSSMREGYAEMKCEPFEYGQRKWVLAGDRWREHRLVVFPNISCHGGTSFKEEAQIRVPIDDTHTWHINYQWFSPAAGVEAPRQDLIPCFDVPFNDEHGNPRFDYITGQDFMAWWSQGEITDRTEEHLGYTDMPVIQYRRTLEEQLDLVAEGGTPLNVFRDPERNVLIDLPGPIEQLGDGRSSDPPTSRFFGDLDSMSPHREAILDLYRRSVEAARAISPSPSGRGLG